MHGADLLDRLGGLIGNLTRDLARERVERFWLPPADSYICMGRGSSVFSHFFATERNRNMADSLSEAMVMQVPFGLSRTQAQPQQEILPTVQLTAGLRAAEAALPPATILWSQDANRQGYGASYRFTEEEDY